MLKDEPGPIRLLRKHWETRVAKNRAYSLRAFARDLGVSHSYLSQLLNGHLPLSVAQAARMSRSLKLGERGARAFVDEVIEARAQASPRRKRGGSEFRTLEQDRFFAIRDWYHFAILDLTMVTGFRPEPRWISKRLGISLAEASLAIERLLRLGLLVNEGGTLRKTQAKLSVPTKRYSRAMRDFHRQMIGKALVALQSEKRRDFEARDVTAAMIPVNVARLAEAKRRITSFRRRMVTFLSEGGPCDELYQLNIQLFCIAGRSR